MDKVVRIYKYKNAFNDVEKKMYENGRMKKITVLLQITVDAVIKLLICLFGKSIHSEHR